MADTTTPICALDIESDGIHPGRKPWEVGMIRRDANGERETSFFVDIDLSTADPFGLNVGRFYERHPRGRFLSGRDTMLDQVVRPTGEPPCLPVHAAAERVATWTHGAHIVGAVPNFDTECLGGLLRDHGLIPAWHYHLIDVEALAVGYLCGAFSSDDVGTRVAPPWRSDDLAGALGLSPVSEEERHTALGDARFALRIYDRVMG